MDIQNFDDIRPFRDDELHAHLEELSRQPEMIMLLKRLFPKRTRQNIIETLNSFQSIDEFQKKLIRSIVLKFSSTTTTGISMSGAEKVAGSPNRLFISNHRDILLDPSFLDVLLLENGRDTCEIAIGDNLFVAPWIETVVRINKSFIVKRNVPVRQMLEVSAKLSAYIRYVITEKQTSVWIAQREGRAKDSNDRTQESLIKMLNISGKSDMVENMKELNITPITISYEYDPCDYLKAKEFQQKRDNPEYKKTPEDDRLNMLTGLLGWKGDVHYEIDNMDDEIASIESVGRKNDQITALAQLIDKHIHKNYRIHLNNIIALDLLRKENAFVNKYSEIEKQKFEKYLHKQLDKIDLPNKDIPFLRGKILEMYANPFINYLKANDL